MSGDFLDLKRCTALLADAIARADRWYARREATLAALEHDAASAVSRLRAAGLIQPAIVSDPTGA